MKIIICSSKVPFIRGGTELLNKWIIEELKKRGFQTEEVSIPLIWKKEIDILNNYNAWNSLDLSSAEVVADLVIATKFPSYIIHHPRKVIWLFHQFRQIYDWAGTEFGWKCNTPLQVEIRDKLIRMDNTAFAEAKKIFAISKNVAKRLKKYNGFDAEVLYPFPPNKDEYKCVKYNNYILHVGRLEKNKRADLILEGFKKAAIGCHLIFVGEGSQRIELEKQALNMGIEDKVKFLGWINKEQLLKLYAEALAIIFAAYDEDYGLVVSEAFLSRKAVLATSDSGGAIELVRDKETGMICEPNVDAIAECFVEAAKNKNRLIEMGENAFKMIKSWSWDEIINKILS